MFFKALLKVVFNLLQFVFKNKEICEQCFFLISPHSCMTDDNFECYQPGTHVEVTRNLQGGLLNLV